MSKKNQIKDISVINSNVNKEDNTEKISNEDSALLKGEIVVVQMEEEVEIIDMDFSKKDRAEILSIFGFAESKIVVVKKKMTNY
jgi:hypothetical protein